MKRAASFIFAFGVAAVWAMLAVALNWAPDWTANVRLPLLCALMGGLGGTGYCLRAIYFNACVRGNWDDQWLPWYFIRPFASVLFGGVSYVFLQAGLLVLDAPRGAEASSWGYLAVAFIAGLNVDGIMARLEQIAESAWGIRPTRLTRHDSSGSTDEES